MTPKIDYMLLGHAVEHYQNRGFTYVEVPWIVSEHTVRATLPDWASFMELGVKSGHAAHDDMLVPYYGGENALVGSAEQGFLQLQLSPGLYVGVTPCFRCEETHDLFYQDCFMKVELFDNRESPDVNRLLGEAHDFVSSLGPLPIKRETSEGVDLTIGGVEIGSYGMREHKDYGRWAYGTGLALPRFSVARALARIL